MYPDHNIATILLERALTDVSMFPGMFTTDLKQKKPLRTCK
jgi:hypothetical protein